MKMVKNPIWNVSSFQTIIKNIPTTFETMFKIIDKNEVNILFYEKKVEKTKKNKYLDIMLINIKESLNILKGVIRSCKTKRTTNTMAKQK